VRLRITHAGQYVLTSWQRANRALERMTKNKQQSVGVLTAFCIDIACGQTGRQGTAWLQREYFAHPRGLGFEILADLVRTALAAVQLETIQRPLRDMQSAASTPNRSGALPSLRTHKSPGAHVQRSTCPTTAGRGLHRASQRQSASITQDS